MKPSQERALDRLAGELVTPERFNHEYQQPIVIPINRRPVIAETVEITELPLPETRRVYDLPEAA